MDEVSRVRVLQSFKAPRPTTNPYIIMLHDALVSTSGIEVVTFTWRRALLGRYDVFHAHWPEILVSGSGRLKGGVRQVLFGLMMLRFSLLRTAVVRTQHNLHLPSDLSPFQRRLLRWFDRETTLRIVLNRQPTPWPSRTVLIPHGDYRTWFSRYEVSSPVSGRLAYFGLIRRYKNVDGLLRAFRALEGDVTLHVAGSPSSDELAGSLSAIAAEDPRVDLSLQFLSDQQLVDTVTAAELIVLPYTHMYNSGGALAALSLNRPVLVPETAVNAELALEVGDGWVHRYAGSLDAVRIQEVLAVVESGLRSSPRPDLSGRGWGDAGIRHARVYHEALRLREARAARAPL